MMATKAASLADDLVTRFEHEIARGELKPGDRFPTEKTISERFAVSRTVVREAFARLAARNLLVSRRGSGAYVADGANYQAFQVGPEQLRDVDDVLRLLEMRMALETEMADLAARRRTEPDLAAMRDSLAAMDEACDVDSSIAADTAFHGAIAAATHNEHFRSFTAFLGIRLVPPRRSYMSGDDPATHQSWARTINGDHRAIYEAIAAGDPAGARAAARRHMENSAERHRAAASRAAPAQAIGQ